MSALPSISGALHKRADQEKDHFYPTPPEGTRALLAVESFDGSIWECACGAGDMSREFEAAGYDVVSTDLVSRGYGQARIDFLMEYRLLAANVATNPPFKLAEQFVRHALGLGARKVAMLVRLHFLEGMERAELFAEYPPARVWVFPWRLCITPGEVKDDRGGGSIPYAWVIWEQGHAGQTVLGWLPSVQDRAAA
jgi:hypothetical protein